MFSFTLYQRRLEFISFTQDAVSFTQADKTLSCFLQGLDVEAENCAVCIENFKVKDVVRILPCKYVLVTS